MHCFTKWMSMFLTLSRKILFLGTCHHLWHEICYVSYLCIWMGVHMVSCNPPPLHSVNAIIFSGYEGGSWCFCQRLQFRHPFNNHDSISYRFLKGEPHCLPQYRSWLRHCATSRKVAVSILDEVIEFFSWPNPSSHTVVLGSTQL
jgi:hypothetical protein